MKPTDGRILDYLMGDLSAEEATAFEAEMSADPELQSELSFYRQIMDSANAMPLVQPPPELGAQIIDSAAQAIRRERGGSNVWQRFFTSFNQPLLMAATAVVILAIGSVAVMRLADQKDEEQAVDQFAEATDGSGTSEELDEEMEEVLDEPVAEMAAAAPEEMKLNERARRSKEVDGIMDESPSGTLHSAKGIGSLDENADASEAPPTRLRKSKPNSRRNRPEARRKIAQRNKYTTPPAAPEPAAIAPAPTRAETTKEVAVGLKQPTPGGVKPQLSELPTEHPKLSGRVERSDSSPAAETAMAFVEGEGVGRSGKGSGGGGIRSVEDHGLGSRGTGVGGGGVAKAKAKKSTPQVNWQTDLRALITQKSWKTALERAEKFAADIPGLKRNPAFLLLYAEIAMENGKRNQARTLLNQLKDLEPSLSQRYKTQRDLLETRLNEK
ncbi:MAG: hypothetical protein CMH54_06050 [Myxococcales bacterium]|nr:hypothetical protein [Myxococcales bacterium]